MPPDPDLARLSKWKTTQRKPAERLGDEVISIFKKDIEKQQLKFGRVGQAWLEIVPRTLQTNAELSALSRGTLTVIVQGSTHLYTLKHAMLAGLQQQLLIACRRDGLKKINLKPGKLTR